MNFKKTMFALAVGSVGIMSAMSAHAVALTNGTQLTLDAGVPTFDAYGYLTNVSSGSWFAMDTDNNGKIAGTEKTAISMGTTGIVIGASNTALGAIDAQWSFYGNPGYHFVTTAITGSTEAGLDMSGWTVNWNGGDISMGSGAWTPGNTAIAGMAAGPYSSGVGIFSWDGVAGHAYTLDYTATVPSGSFTGVKYGVHLTGTVNPVPEASTYGMMLAGLGMVGFVASRRRKSMV